MLTDRLGAQRAAAEPSAVAEIATRCAGLPLALAVSAQPDMPLATLAGELRDTGTRLDALDGGDPATRLRAVFSWSYDALSPASARLFRLLGLHPGPDVAAPAATSTAGVPLTRARALLGPV
ncbi:hypothetical protein ACH4UM_34560 [Streptomyces sp. NPDC020801]|uniref:hypothetical protein n=1 Tax=unclassified Streptomyces TaxID=2593676 RepID=UPI003795995D